MGNAVFYVRPWMFKLSKIILVPCARRTRASSLWRDVCFARQSLLSSNWESHGLTRRGLSCSAVKWKAPGPTPREVLGLPRNKAVLDPKEIRLAYFKQAQRYHPDTYANLNLTPQEIEFRQQMFNKITIAYDSLLISPDLYTVLGIDPKEFQAEARHSAVYISRVVMSYQERMRALQGDFNNQNRQQQLQDLQDAFRVLTDDELRTKYDSGIRDLQNELKEHSEKHKVDLGDGVPRRKWYEHFAVYIKVLGVATLVVGFGFYKDSIRNMSVRNTDKWNIVTEADFDKDGQRMSKQEPVTVAATEEEPSSSS